MVDTTKVLWIPLQGNISPELNERLIYNLRYNFLVDTVYFWVIIHDRSYKILKQLFN